jgi:hypothetical protein
VVKTIRYKSKPDNAGYEENKTHKAGLEIPVAGGFNPRMVKGKPQRGLPGDGTADRKMAMKINSAQVSGYSARTSPVVKTIRYKSKPDNAGYDETKPAGWVNW